MKKRGTFDRNFKLEILQQIEQSRMNEVCKEDNFHHVLVTRWKREQQQYPKVVFKGGKGS
ncbi:transposase [Candidatus Woesearchaeota archaeon]|nr:transposase [Candidatus Woesearchaeota archaeon]